MSDESRIPSDCLNLLFTYVPHEDKTTTSFIALLADNDTDTELLAQKHSERVLASHVARGEQVAATAMLTLNPELALESTDVIGYTKFPAFVDTAVKCAGYSRDHHMLWMIIDKIEAIPDTETERKLKLVTDMLNQLAEIPEYFSLKPLKDAYKKYLAEYATALTSRSRTACDAAWLAIGVEQNKKSGLPPCVAKYYCNPNLPLYPYPSAAQLDSRTTPPSDVLTFDDYSTGAPVPQHWAAAVGLGIDFTLFRLAASGGVGVPHVGGPRARTIADLAAIEALDVARTMEVLEINSYLTALRICLEKSIAAAPSQRPTF